MRPHCIAGWVVLIAAASVSANSSAQGQDHPLMMRDISQMRRDRVSHREIVEKATEQGVGFEVTSSALNQLRRLGFSPDQITAIKDAYSPRTKAEPVVPGQGLRTTDTQRDRELEQMQRIIKASGADVLPAPSQHFTLWAAKDVQPIFLPDIQRLEKFLQTRFKEPIRSGLDKRSAHIILLKSRYEYENWIRAMFEVLGDPAPQPDNPGSVAELKASLAKGFGYVPRRFAVFCTEGQQPDWIHRIVATGMGYMVFTQLAESQQNESLATGFANGLETVLAGTPTVMLFSNSYHNENRDLGADPRAWIHLVQQRLATRRISPVGRLLAMDTSTMLLPQYAESWTLVGMLAKQPGKFGELILGLREDKVALDVIQRVYGWDEKQLTQEWHKYLLGQR